MARYLATPQGTAPVLAGRFHGCLLCVNARGRARIHQHGWLLGSLVLTHKFTRHLSSVGVMLHAAGIGAEVVPGALGLELAPTNRARLCHVILERITAEGALSTRRRQLNYALSTHFLGGIRDDIGLLVYQPRDPRPEAGVVDFVLHVLLGPGRGRDPASDDAGRFPDRRKDPATRVRNPIGP